MTAAPVEETSPDPAPLPPASPGGIQQSASKTHVAAAQARNGASPDAGEEVPEEVEPPITYPLPFRKVLCSFKGRLNRRAYWLRGIIPMFIMDLVVNSVIGGLMAILFGALLVSAVTDFTGDMTGIAAMVPGLEDTQPVERTEFREAGGRITGTITEDTGPATIEVTMTAEKSTDTVTKRIIVGGREL
jgi:hypothetical protein